MCGTCSASTSMLASSSSEASTKADTSCSVFSSSTGAASTAVPVTASCESLAIISLARSAEGTSSRPYEGSSSSSCAIMSFGSPPLPMKTTMRVHKWAANCAMLASSLIPTTPPCCSESMTFAYCPGWRRSSLPSIPSPRFLIWYPSPRVLASAAWSMLDVARACASTRNFIVSSERNTDGLACSTAVQHASSVKKRNDELARAWH